jgi:hypothetical protein
MTTETEANPTTESPKRRAPTRKPPAVAKPRKVRQKRPVVIQKDGSDDPSICVWLDLVRADHPAMPVANFPDTAAAITFIREKKLPAGRYRICRVLRTVNATPITIQRMLFTDDAEVLAVNVQEEAAPAPAGGE